MNTKRLIMSIGMLAFVGAVVVGGTGAFFSDTETSGANVFTAGSVSIDLLSIEHDYYGEDADIPQNYFTTNTSGNVPIFAFNDLKPGDTGLITSVLENGENDAFFCARTTLAETDTPFENLLRFRVNSGLGLTAAQTFAPIALGQWYSLDAADAANPAGGALAVAAEDSADLELEYCFGTFVPGQTGLAGCEVQNPGDPSVWNAAQGQSISITTEYYAVQQRNNEGFMCGDLNVPDVAPSAGEITGVDAEYVAFDDGSTVYTGVYVGFDEIDVTDATAVELRLNLDDGTDYSIFGQTSVLNAVNASPAAFSIGGTVITTGSRTSSSWSPQTGTIGNGRSVVNVEVLITLGDGTVITSTIDEASITGQATKGAAFPS